MPQVFALKILLAPCLEQKVVRAFVQARFYPVLKQEKEVFTSWSKAQEIRQYVNGKVGLEHTVESYGLCSCFVYLIC